MLQQELAKMARGSHDDMEMDEIKEEVDDGSWGWTPAEWEEWYRQQRWVKDENVDEGSLYGVAEVHLPPILLVMSGIGGRDHGKPKKNGPRTIPTSSIQQLFCLTLLS